MDVEVIHAEQINAALVTRVRRLESLLTQAERRAELATLRADRLQQRFREIAAETARTEDYLAELRTMGAEARALRARQTIREAW